MFVFGLDREAPPSISLNVDCANGKTETITRSVAKREYHIERVEGLPPKTVTPDPETAKRIEARTGARRRRAQTRR